MKIEKYIPTSLIDYPQHIATVVFTIGCNWDCWYCQNRPLLSQNEPSTTIAEFFDFLRSRQQWLDGVVVCGGEPTLHPDLFDFIKDIKSLGYDVKLDTNGSHPEVISRLLEANLLDYIAMDIKAPLSRYDCICGRKVDIEAIQQSIHIIKNSNIDYEFRTTVSPDLGISDLLDIAKLIQGARIYYLQQYIPINNSCPPAHPLNVLQDAVARCNDITFTKLR